jgi:cell division protein FtsL
MRFLHVLVIGLLIFAASYVYKIKFDSTRQAERVAKLHDQIRKERNAIAALRAEWAKLDSPARIQALAERHLKLKEALSTQFEQLDALPARPPAPPEGADAIGRMVKATAPAPVGRTDVTGSIPARR